MSHMAPGDATAAVAAYLQQHETKDLLRFITCGSVDDRSEEHTSELQSL